MSGLEARWTQLDAIAEDMQEYVDKQFVTLHGAMASLTPALAPPEAQPAALDNSGTRATAVMMARVARAASVGHHKIPSTGSF